MRIPLWYNRPPMNEQQTKPNFKQQLPLYFMAIMVLTLDQLSKWWIEANLDLGDIMYPIESIGQYFNFYHIANTGAAFGMFQNGGWVLSVVAFVVAGGILYYNSQLPVEQRTARLTLGVMLGGALGNVTDRFRIGEFVDGRFELGHVTDFINFNLRPLVVNYPALDFQLLDWPIFNVADMSVVGGVIVLMVLMYKEEQAELARQQAVHTAVEADLNMTAASRRLPQLYTYQPGWTKEIPAPPPETEALPKARFAFRSLIGLSVALVISLTVLLMSLSNSRRRRKRQ